MSRSGCQSDAEPSVFSSQASLLVVCHGFSILKTQADKFADTLGYANG